MSDLPLDARALALAAAERGALAWRRRPCAQPVSWRARVRRGLHGTSSATMAAIASALLLAAATGWMYWIRPFVATWPGPAVAALPLDELALHDRLPLVVVLVALAVASLPAGLAARAAGLERLTAAAVLGVASGVWGYLQVAASYYVVRQLPLREVLVQASSAPVVYLSAAVLALAGAVLGRERRTGSASTALAAAGVALAGGFDVLAGLLPGASSLGGVAPGAVLHLAQAVDLPAGVALLACSRGLARRSHAAWSIVVVALGLSAFDRLAAVPGGSLPAVLTVALLALLVARRADYGARPDPAALARTLRRLAIGVPLCALVGGVAVALHEVAADRALPAGDSLGYSSWLAEAIRALGGQPPALVTPGEASFFAWFPWTVSAAVALAGLWAFAPLLASWRGRFRQSGAEAEAALALLRRYGQDSLAPFALRADKSLFFAPDAGRPVAHAVIAYRVVRGVALATGAPIGLPPARRAAMAEFCSFAHNRGWRVAVLGVSAEDLAAYESLGLVGVYHGDEAFIDVTRFSLHGGAMKSVRQAANRVERYGYQSSVVFAGDVTPQLRREMAGVEAAWLGGQPRKGFAMELDDLFRLGEDDALFVLGWDAWGTLAGFLHLAACPAASTMSLSSMPRLHGTPNGFSSWLIVRAVEWCALYGYDTVSLNFSPLAGLFDPQAPASPSLRFQRRVARAVQSALGLQLDNLQRFNRQFGPDFHPRYLVLDRFTDLPRVVVAAMAAEGHLPFAERLRGWPAPVVPVLDTAGTVGEVAASEVVLRARPVRHVDRAGAGRASR